MFWRDLALLEPQSVQMGKSLQLLVGINGRELRLFQTVNLCSLYPIRVLLHALLSMKEHFFFVSICVWYYVNEGTWYFLFYKHMCLGILSRKEHDMIIVLKVITSAKAEGNSNLVFTLWSWLLRSDSVKCTLLEASHFLFYNSHIWSCMKV